MTERTVPLCIAPNCGQPAILNNALCAYHKEILQGIENDLLSDAGRRIRADMRQFERLLLVEPPLHSADIAHRMPWSINKVRQMLQKFKDDRA